jgi:hypothetical protein
MYSVHQMATVRRAIAANTTAGLQSMTQVVTKCPGKSRFTADRYLAGSDLTWAFQDRVRIAAIVPGTV